MAPRSVAATKEMIPATSSVGSCSSNETEGPDVSLGTDSGDGNRDGTNPTEFLDIRETISVAALQASSQQQPEAVLPQCIVGDNETSETASTAAMSPRAYQLEMLDQSMKQNAIVVVSLPKL